MAGITFHFSEQSTARFDIGRVIFTSSGIGLYDDHIKFTPGNDEDQDGKGDEPQLKRHRGDADVDAGGRERSRHGPRHDNDNSRRREEDSRTRKSRPIKETSRSSHRRRQSRRSRRQASSSTRSISLSISKLKEDFQSVLGKLTLKPRLDKTTARPSQSPAYLKMFAALNEIPQTPNCCRVPATPELLKPCPRTPTFDIPFRIV